MGFVGDVSFQSNKQVFPMQCAAKSMTWVHGYLHTQASYLLIACTLRPPAATLHLMPGCEQTFVDAGWKRDGQPIYRRVPASKSSLHTQSRVIRPLPFPALYCIAIV